MTESRAFCDFNYVPQRSVTSIASEYFASETRLSALMRKFMDHYGAITVTPYYERDLKKAKVMEDFINWDIYHRMFPDAK